MEELTTKIKKYLKASEKAHFNIGDSLTENILIYDGYNYSTELNAVFSHISNLESIRNFKYLTWAADNEIEKLSIDCLFGRDSDFYIKYLFCLFKKEKFVEGAIANAEKSEILELIFLSLLKEFENQAHYWLNLSHLELGKFSEYYAKMEFLKNGFQVYQIEVDDRGIDFATVLGDRLLEIQVKSIRLKTTSYVFFTKTDKFFIRKSLYICLVLFSEDLNPNLYLIPSLELDADNGLFVFRGYGKEGQKSKPEWGINLNKKHLDKLKKYAIDLAMIKLKI